jgi:hypothetical protein
VFLSALVNQPDALVLILFRGPVHARRLFAWDHYEIGFPEKCIGGFDDVEQKASPLGIPETGAEFYQFGSGTLLSATE